MNGKHKFSVSLHFSKFHINANFVMSNEQQPPPPKQNLPFLMGDLDSIKYTILLVEPTHNPKWQLDCFTWFYRAMPQILHSLHFNCLSHFSKIHARFQQIDRQNEHKTQPIPIADNAATWPIMLR